MRIVKFLAVIVLPSLMLAARLDRALAQLPTPNPLVVPLAAPPPPQQLLAPVQPQGLPSLVAIPTARATYAAPSTSRIFNCSCFGPGTGTHWMGEVSAAGYFAARQGAVSACLSYNTNKQPAPPAVPIQTPSSNLSAPNMPGVSIPANMAASVGQSMPGTINFSSSAQLRECSQCTCD
jgi:hypothetical protein